MGTNLLLVLREELVCLIILGFILLYGQLYEMGKDAPTLRKLCIYGIGHVVFDIITVITVNNADTVPVFLNWIFHIIFFLFAAFFTEQLFFYTVGLVFEKQKAMRIHRLSQGITGACAVLMLMMPIRYLSGVGTMYSSGPAVFLGYGLATVFLVSSGCIIIKEHRRLPDGARKALVPMLFFALTMIVLQILVPELLFTGAAVTIISVGFFFSLANPIVALQQKANTDVLTGVFTRRRYQDDLVEMNEDFHNGIPFTFLFFDINDLKMVNDTYGHLEGDVYIAKTASIMSRTLINTKQVYRMGGDEFLAVYRDTPEESIRKEIAAFLSLCESESKDLPYRISVSTGYASTGEGYATLSDVLRAADFQMYTNKVAQKRERSYKTMQNSDRNISGLTDRILDAMDLCGKDDYLCCCNLSTDVARISDSMRRVFGFEGLFVSSFRSAWNQRVHPDDRNQFWDDRSTISSGYECRKDFFFRVMAEDGTYFHCHCRGTVLRGRGSDCDILVCFIRKIV